MERGYCIDCKHYTWNGESKEWQCWRDDSKNDGIAMDDLDRCQAIISGGKFGYEPL